MKKYLFWAALAGLLFNLACDSNSPTASSGGSNPPGRNPSPTYRGTIFELENSGAKFRLAVAMGETIGVRTDKETQIYSEQVGSFLEPADLREREEVSVEGFFQGSGPQKELTVKAEYIIVHAPSEKRRMK